MEKSGNRVLKFSSPKGITTLITLKVLLSKYAGENNIRKEIIRYVKAIIETGEPPEEQVRWSK